MKRTKTMSVLMLSLLCVACCSFLSADDYTLEISKIVMTRSPQTGDLYAGCSVCQASEKDNWDACLGEATLVNDNMVFPVNIELGGLRPGEAVVMSIGMDESRAKAGKDNAEYKFEFTFKVFPTRNKEKIYSCTQEAWSFKIHYRLTK
jgi:hypothetical protein